MEEDRIGHMYLNLWKQRIVRLWEAAFPRGVLRSSVLFGGVAAVLIIGPGVAWQLHRRGQFGRAKRKIHREIAGGYVSGPGGLAPIRLSRKQTQGGKNPEFLSATLLPGLGMSVLQITAYLPGRGETPLLAAAEGNPAVSSSVSGLSSTNDNQGAFEVPWGGELVGAPTPVETVLTVNWQGHDLNLPTNVPGHPDISNGGLLSGQSVDDSHATATGDGAQADGLFRSSTFDDHWVSRTDTTVSAQLSANRLELTIDAKNTGDTAEPMGMGWHPRFEVVGGLRNKVMLRLPDGERMEIKDAGSGMRTAKVTDGGTGDGRLQGHPVEIGAGALDESVVNLGGAGADPAESLEMRDPGAGFGLRMTALSASIRAVRATSPADAGYVSLGMQTNMDDPLGKEWTGNGSGGITTLEPGQTLEWKVRLEIFPVGKP